MCWLLRKTIAHDMYCPLLLQPDIRGSGSGVRLRLLCAQQFISSSESIMAHHDEFRTGSTSLIPQPR